MEGSYHFWAAYDYLITPQPISVEKFKAETLEAQKLFEEEGRFFDADLTRWIEPEERLKHFVDNNYR